MKQFEGTANLYMEKIEGTALSTAATPRLWLRYGDDTFVIQQEEHKQNFLENINNVDPANKFTVENSQQGRAILFLYTIVEPQADNTLSHTAYRKPMHTDQYLQWDSHHHLVAKYSIISTLTHRARTVCTTTELLNQELQHLREALTKCKYPKQDLDKIEKDLSATTRMGATWKRTRMNKVGVRMTTTMGTLRKEMPPRIDTPRAT